MKIGMLWFDNDPHTTLAAKVEKAAAYYITKYGRIPTVCFVHPSMLPTPPQDVGMEVRPTKSVLPNHFWLGVNAAN